MHRFIIRVVSLLSTLTYYFAQQNKKNVAPIRELISYLQNEENSNMEDRLHVHWTRAKQLSNDRQYLILLGTHGHPK